MTSPPPRHDRARRALPTSRQCPRRRPPRSRRPPREPEVSPNPTRRARCRWDRATRRRGRVEPSGRPGRRERRYRAGRPAPDRARTPRSRRGRAPRRRCRRARPAKIDRRDDMWAETTSPALRPPRRQPRPCANGGSRTPTASISVPCRPSSIASACASSRRCSQRSAWDSWHSAPVVLQPGHAVPTAAASPAPSPTPVAAVATPSPLITLPPLGFGPLPSSSAPIAPAASLPGRSRHDPRPGRGASRSTCR